MKLKGTTDFSWFLQSNQNPRIDIKINNTVIPCSACFLAAYSPVFYDIIMKNDFSKCNDTAYRFVKLARSSCPAIQLLDEFSDQYDVVKGCVNVLYGGAMELTFDNLETVIKFSVHFKITGMYHQAYEWAEQAMCIKNFPDLLRCAFSVRHIDLGRRRADLGLTENDAVEYVEFKDLSYLCETFVNSCLDKWRLKIWPEGEKPPIISAFEDIIHSEDYDKQELVNFLLKLKIIRLEHTFPLLGLLLDNDTAESILKKLYEYDDRTNMLLLYYDNNVIEDFLKTLDGISGSSYNDQKYYAYIKEKFEFRKKKMLEIKNDTENEQVLYRFLSSKTWRSFTLAEIRNLPIKYKLDNFMLAEICWGWLHSNRQASKSDVYKIWNMIYASFDDAKSLCFYKKILKDQFVRDFDVKDLNYSEHVNHNRSLEKSSMYKETQLLPYVGMNAIDTENLLNEDTKNGMLATVKDFPSFSMPCYEHPLSSKLPYKVLKNIDSDCYHGISQIVRDLCHPFLDCNSDDVRRNLPCYVSGSPRCLASVEVSHPDDQDDIGKLTWNYFKELHQKDCLRQTVFHWYLAVECGSDVNSTYTPYSHKLKGSKSKNKKVRNSAKSSCENLTIPCEDTKCPGYQPHYFELVSPIAYDKTEFVQKLSTLRKQKNCGRVFVCLLSRKPCYEQPDFDLEIGFKDLLARTMPEWRKPMEEHQIKEEIESDKNNDDDDYEDEDDCYFEDEDDYYDEDEDEDEDEDGHYDCSPDGVQDFLMKKFMEIQVVQDARFRQELLRYKSTNQK